jgi:hypothetical protein
MSNRHQASGRVDCMSASKLFSLLHNFASPSASPTHPAGSGPSESALWQRLGLAERSRNVTTGLTRDGFRLRGRSDPHAF